MMKWIPLNGFAVRLHSGFSVMVLNFAGAGLKK